jgi:mRNA-degrading endonuclease RelE of RelBE toxin-antitoxin system
MYAYDIDEELVSKLKKLEKRDKMLYMAVEKKIIRIAEDPHLGKPLSNVLKYKRRAHVGHFVLIYEINEKESKVIFLEFEHHDVVYK